MIGIAKSLILNASILLLLGCSPAIRVTGYGEGESRSGATLAAWQNARDKLDAAGFADRGFVQERVVSGRARQQGGRITWVETAIEFRVQGKRSYPPAIGDDTEPSPALAQP